jgi:gliding motility-associated protein GldM
MSGGKETPRQKMIGMMYLFYTALLALQVSNSVLEKFVFIDKSLSKQVTEISSRNGDIVVRINQAVEERKNRAADIVILNKAKEVREETAKVLKYCKDLKEEMVQITGGYDENGNIVGVKDQDKVANLMINKQKGIELKNILNNYAQYLTDATGGKVKITPIALDGKDDPVFKNDKDQRVKNFSELTFETTPTAAGMASVSNFMTVVVNHEAEVLERLAQEVGAEEQSFDVIVVMAKPDSKYVAAGTNYTADLFLAASSAAANPEMFVDGQPINVEGGFGKVQFRATASSFDKEGMSAKTYKAAIHYNDTIFEQTIDYYVVRPTLQITSDAVKALYLNCGNPLNVQCPQLGTQFSPTFSATGATTIPDKSNKNSVTVVPTGAKTVTLAVSSNGVNVGSEKFPVRRVPIPTISLLKDNGEVVNEARGEQLPRSISLKVNPDADFANALPSEARYRVTKWRVILAAGTSILQQATPTSESFDLRNWQGQAKKGTRIVVEINEIQRANFRNELEKVQTSQMIKQFQIM